MDKRKKTDGNPLTEESAPHPAGAAAGAAGGAAAGAAAGSIAGPAGVIAGGVIGGIAGGAGGSAAAEAINPTVEDSYWRENYRTQPYIQDEVDYAAWQPAYRTGYTGFARYRERFTTFDDAESALRSDYEGSYSDTGLRWERAKDAVRDAWNRVQERGFGSLGDRPKSSV